VSDERRGSPRVAASLAGELETPEGKTSIAISRDISSGGLLIFARTRQPAGATLSLTVVFQGEQVTFEGTVLRCEELEPGSSTLWRTQIALAVDEKNEVLGRIYAALAAAPPEN